MAERVYSDWERETALWQAQREGDKAAAETWGCSPTTIRSWRHRAQRKTTDRDREGGAAGSSPPSASPRQLTDVQVPTDEWDGAAGCYRKVSARARVFERFEVGGQFMSQGELRELRAPGTGGLAVGELVLLGGSRFAEFGDELWPDPIVEWHRRQLERLGQPSP